MKMNCIALDNQKHTKNKICKIHSSNNLLLRHNYENIYVMIANNSNLLSNRKAIGFNWVFKVKYYLNSIVAKYKARLIA